jgi:hypothetical protein
LKTGHFIGFGANFALQSLITGDYVKGGKRGVTASHPKDTPADRKKGLLHTIKYFRLFPRESFALFHKYECCLRKQ